MNSADAEAEYQALEQYLQQAKEELGLAFLGPSEKCDPTSFDPTSSLASSQNKSVISQTDNHVCRYGKDENFHHPNSFKKCNNELGGSDVKLRTEKSSSKDSISSILDLYSDENFLLNYVCESILIQEDEGECDVFEPGQQNAQNSLNIYQCDLDQGHDVDIESTCMAFDAEQETGNVFSKKGEIFKIDIVKRCEVPLECEEFCENLEVSCDYKGRPLSVAQVGRCGAICGELSVSSGSESVVNSGVKGGMCLDRWKQSSDGDVQFQEVAHKTGLEGKTDHLCKGIHNESDHIETSSRTTSNEEEGMHTISNMLHPSVAPSDEESSNSPALPPPSVDQTESIISQTLNQHKVRQKFPRTTVSKSQNPIKSTGRDRKKENVQEKGEKPAAEFRCRMQSEGDNLVLLVPITLHKPSPDHDISNTHEMLPERTINKSDNEGVQISKLKFAPNKTELERGIRVQKKSDEVLHSFSHLLINKGGKSLQNERLSSDEDCAAQCHVPKFCSVGTNTTDSIDRQVLKVSSKLIHNEKEHANNKPNESDQNGFNILLDKPKNFPEKFHNRPSLKSFENDNSPEMQVVVNSLSPVLLRRKPSNRTKRKEALNHQVSTEKTDSKVVSENTQSLFMDPQMSQTWHGATSRDWCENYGPKIRAMIENENHSEHERSFGDQSREYVNLDYDYKTLPSQNLLDEMHRKFCADQYVNNSDAQLTRAMVLLKLKSHLPSTNPRCRPRRSASFNVRTTTAKPFTGMFGFSPMLPRRQFTQQSQGSDSSLDRSSLTRKLDESPPPQDTLKLSKSREATPERLAREKQESGREDAEIEAVEACRWLKETGFPQYAQMYEDGQFPVDITAVEKDHDFLDKEDIQSLFRRLNTLNKCAIMKINTPTKKEAEESDDEDQCALSDKWKYQRSSRQWSRKDLYSPTSEENGRSVLTSTSSHDSLLADQNSSSETGDSPVLDSKMNHMRSLDDTGRVQTSTPVDYSAQSTNSRTPKVFRRAASERLKGAKSFLKRVESLSRSKKGHKGPRTIAEISGPVITDRDEMQEKIRHLNCKDISPSTENPPSGILNNSVASNSGANNTSRALSPVSENGTSSVHTATKSTLDRSNLSNTSDGALGFSLLSEEQDSDSIFSDTFILPSDYRPGQFPKQLLATQADASQVHSDHRVNIRTGSFSYGNEIVKRTQFENSSPVRRGSHDPKHRSCDTKNSSNRKSIYDNVPLEEDLNEAQQELDLILAELFANINGLNKAINGEDAEILKPPPRYRDDHNSSINTSHEVDNSSVDFESVMPPGGDIENSVHHDEETENEVTSGTTSSPEISDHELHAEELSHDDSAEHIECRERRDSGVGSSLTRTSSERGKYRIRWHSFQKSHRPSTGSRNLQISNLSAGQIMLLQKLSLLKLTALIEKYSPNRSTWSWTVPRFMKRNKSPDFKDRNVFGVPFHVTIQRTGQALPQCMLYAMRFLRRTEGEAVGIFRKSGVRSRIQKLRHEIEANPESVDFEQLQAYDVADLLKQYFRELPECLLTNKLSDVFMSIFLYIPADQRLEALQAAVILLPDENRDVLQSLLLFLSDVASHAAEHQMTSSNLAVCFAPSLFNMGGSRSSSSTPSPRRTRKNPGIPDARELQEQKAAHECLTLMIQECKKLFMIPSAILSKCRCWHNDPVTLEELNLTGTEEGSGYHGYIESCIQGLLKESRDKFRGWVSYQLPGDCDVSYKKVGDGHPLRLWKATIEVEAPPMEVMIRVLNERHLWDEDLLQWNTVEKLDEHTEVFQYERNSMAPHPSRDFVLLRSWRTDLPKGVCVLISTSIEHPKAQPWGGLQGVELASRYLIEPSGARKSRLTHISRVDIRGHSPEWYKRVYGHLCVQFMEKIRDSFKKETSGKETNV